MRKYEKKTRKYIGTESVLICLPLQNPMISLFDFNMCVLYQMRSLIFYNIRFCPNDRKT